MPKLKLHNQRMLELIDFIVRNRVNRCNDLDQCLKAIGYTSKTNYYEILKGKKGFTQAHIQRICEFYGADANFIHRQEHTGMFYQHKGQDPVIQIRQALREIESRLIQIPSAVHKNVNSKAIRSKQTKKAAL